MAPCKRPPLCCDQYCTHRLFEPEIDWSDSVVNKQISGRGLLASPAVTASWRNGDYVYLVGEIPRPIGGVVRFTYRAAKVNAATGAVAWRSDVLFTTTDTGFIDADRAKATAICSDGSTTWVAIAEIDSTGSPTGLSKVFRLNESTGAVAFAGDPGAGDDLTVYSMTPTGTGKVYLGHQGGRGTGFGYDFVQTWDDDVLTDGFGLVVGSGESIHVSSIVPDGDDIYVAHTFAFTDRFGDCQAEPCDLCTVGGSVSRFDSERKLVWLSPAGTQPKICKSGSKIYVACTGTTTYGQLDDEWGDQDWFRTVDLPTIPDNSCGLTDIACDASHLWLAGCRHVVQTDHDGILESAVPHVHEADIPLWNVVPYTPNGDQVLAIVAIQDETAVGGGKANLCEPETPLDPEEMDTAEVSCDPEATDFCSTGSPGPTGCGPTAVLGPDGTCYGPDNIQWCNVNACGTITTNGRVRISECSDRTKLPPCTGPGVIHYTDCDDEETNASFQFASHCVDGGWKWFGEWDGGSVAFTVPCDGTFGPDDVDLVIDGCTTTVDTATINCDGPLGYASIDFTFSGSCGECAIEGCGAFGATECILPICGCSGVPDTLYATLTNILFCECADAVVVTLTRSGSTWSGSAAFGTCDGGKTINIDLTCNEPDWELAIAITDCTVNVNAFSTEECDPFELAAVVDVPLCCQVLAGNSFTCTITA